MILQSLLFSKLGPPFETPGSWDDWTTYSFTTDPAYGDGSSPCHYTDEWNSVWQHFDNLDHVRPTTGVPTWDAPSQWRLPGRSFPGPAADPIP
mmetsp:Transcript_4287/g.8284  ORF Transcript_4287/g.8284 Transcript_4287/m.8284 type:complete len:93 (+) Transcript_4287:50-328(+)